MNLGIAPHTLPWKKKSHLAAMKNSTIIFDLDGTLVDTAPDLSNTLNHLLKRHGLSPIDPRTIRTMVGQGARKLLERGFEASGVTLEGTEMDDLVDAFIAHYGANIAIDSRPFPGAQALLEQLKAQEAILGVCTNKREDLSVALLQALSLDKYFSAVVGADTLDVRKPHPGHLTGTIARAGGDPCRALMIGDSATDIRTAQAAGIPVVAVSFGYSDPHFENLTPDAVIDHFDALLPQMKTLLRIQSVN